MKLILPTVKFSTPAQNESFGNERTKTVYETERPLSPQRELSRSFLPMYYAGLMIASS